MKDKIKVQGVRGLGGGSLASAHLCSRCLWILYMSPPPYLGLGIRHIKAKAHCGAPRYITANLVVLWKLLLPV